MKKPHSQTVIAVILFFVFLLVAAGFATALAIVFAPIKADVGEDACTLSFLWYKQSATYENVVEITLLDDTYAPTRVKSFGGISKDFGTYKSDDLGKHFRLTYSENKHNYILLKLKDGAVIVFNQKTQDATKSLYEKLSEKILAE